MRLFLSRLLLGDEWTMNRPYDFIPYMLTLVKPRRQYTAEDCVDRDVAREVASTWIPIQRDILRESPDRHRGCCLLKTHNAFVSLEGHAFSARALSDRAIYLVRDPRDVAISLAHHIDRPLDAVVGIMLNKTAMVVPDVDYMPEFWSDWAEHGRSWKAFPFGETLVVRYEDMVDDPFAAFRRTLDYLGWTDDDDSVAAAMADVGFQKLQRDEAEHGFAESPAGRTFFRRGVARGWRDHPEQDELRRLEDAFAEPMTALGYR